MDMIERRVWDALEHELHKRGDTDIQAGLAWISDEDKREVARAVIDAYLAASAK